MELVSDVYNSVLDEEYDFFLGAGAGRVEGYGMMNPSMAQEDSLFRLSTAEPTPVPLLHRNLSIWEGIYYAALTLLGMVLLFDLWLICF